MIPFLRDADFDGALGIALERIDAAATPENAARLQAGRQINAVMGLIGAPVVFMGLAGWAFMSWRRFGKDPVYLDDPSILMPAPPPDLTAASGAFVMDGGTSRRALTTAMLDLASRGPHRLPRGQGPARAVDQGRHRHRAAARRRRRGGAAGPQRAPPDRPGRGGRAPAAAGARRRRALHRSRRPAQVRRGRARLRHRARERTSCRRAGWSRSRARSSAAGPAAACWPSWPAASPCSWASTCPSRGSCSSAWRPSPAASSSSCSPRACPR